VLLDGTIFDVDGRDRTRHTRRNRLLRVKGRIAPPVLPGTPGRSDVCPGYHYHGRLFGRQDPARSGCGWGVVAQYSHLHTDEQHQAGAITHQQLALRTHSIEYATQQLHAARRHLKWVGSWLYGWGEETFEDADEARYKLGVANHLLHRAAGAATRTQRHRLWKRARRSCIRPALKTTWSSIGGMIYHATG
jgi:hypothetical protein